MLLLLAAAFLVESWVWDGFIALARRLVALIPWDAVKARIGAIASNRGVLRNSVKLDFQIRPLRASGRAVG